MAAAPQPAPRTARAVWILAGAALVVLALAMVLLMRQSQQPPTTAPPTTASTSAAAPTSGPRPGSASPAATLTPVASSVLVTPSPVPSSAPSALPTPAAATTKSPVPVGKKAEVETGLTASVSRLEAVTGVANGPGEVAGPSIRATVVLRNESAKTIDLSNTVVNLYYTAAHNPASVLSGPGTKMLPNSVKPGAQVSGTIVFAVPKAQREVILITVDYSVETPVVAFEGPGPT